MSKVLCLMSGGLDSTTAAYWAKKEYGEIEAVSFSYGSKQNFQEAKYLDKICEKIGICRTVINIDFLKKYFKSSLLSEEEVVPLERYDENNMVKTVVPFRNAIFLSIAVGLAESRGLEKVIIGNHSGDHAIYPDCTGEFIEAINKTAQLGTYKKIKIESPFCNLSKADIVKLGCELGVDYSLTYSCYNGREKHCGKCATCLERKEAFKLAGVKDPTEYENGMAES